ncbi:hypothetical protein GDO81_021152 [Engystomops pustulosus]|uniref:Chromo domain-containing protein n=1 Tax=Engystomops pustulosus TaxID=76066 RepID=A0AAV6YQQ5_ENGPU|nr:hypothetical protein GDO81_021152 [Engystomops pustulosus]
MKTVRGRRFFLVDWKGFGPEERSWEPEDNILDRDLLQGFLQPRRRGRPKGGGKDARLYVFRLSAIRKDLEDNQAPRHKYECRENKLEKTKGCHLYAINTHHNHELRVVVAIRNKLLLITRKHSAANMAAGSCPVEAFQYIRVRNL